MAKVTFDGVTKTITINPGETTIDVQIDLYSDWKEWVMLSDNAKFEQAFRTFGGDPTNQTETQFAPRYFFLVNNWQVHASSISVDVQLNLYTDNYPSPYTVDNAAVNARNSDAQVIQSEIENRLDYNGVVHIDTGVTQSGTTYPFGTIAQPVNNLSDAKIIADELNVHTYFIITPNNTCLDFDIDMPNSRFVGSVFPPHINFHNVDVTGSSFERSILIGTFSMSSERILVEHCFIGDRMSPCGKMNLCNFIGTMVDSHLDGDLILSESFMGQLTNCNSAIPGNDHPSLILQGTQSVDLSVRNYSGGLGVRGMTQSGSVATIEVDPGRVTIYDDNTDGIIVLRGVGTVNDMGTGSLTLLTQAFLGDVEDQLDRMEPELFEQGTDIDYIITQIDAQTENISRILGLSQHNYRIFNQIYDNNGNLTSADIRCYPSATDADNDTNISYGYSMYATYSVEGLLTDYKVTQYL